MTDLVTRLRVQDCPACDQYAAPIIMAEAADEIERLRAALEEIDTDGVWNECEYCNRKCRIASEALKDE